MKAESLRSKTAQYVQPSAASFNGPQNRRADSVVGVL
jgi:hypothetical protein